MSLLLAGLAHAGTEISVASLEFHGKIPGMEKAKGSDIVMPFVVAPDAKLEENINDALYIGQLEVPAPRHPGKFLSEADGISIDGIDSQDFSVLRNDDRVLTVEFTGEACGAYCENFVSDYSFDIQSGRQITMSDLITPRGQLALARKMEESRRDMYRDMLATLTQQLKEQRATRDTTGPDQDTQDRIDLNKECMRQAVAAIAELDKSRNSSSFDLSGFALAPEKFIVQVGRCSNHAMRALDDVDHTTFELTYAELKPHLTPYGKSLLFKEGNVQAAGGIYGRFLHGYLDEKTALTMQLHKNEKNEVSGTYYYDKFRRLISLSGHEQDGRIELTEQVVEAPGQQAETAVMHLTLAAGRLQGKWVGKTEHQIELAP